MKPQQDPRIPPKVANTPEGCAIGNDLVFLPEFRSNFNSLFQKKVFTAREITYCDAFSDPLLRYASTFAGKEATYKAVQQLDPRIKLSWRKIEILRDKPAGMPTVHLQVSVPCPHVGLTISHDGDYVWAIALARALRA